MKEWDAFLALPSPSRQGSYTAEQSPHSCRIARAFDGQPAVLIALKTQNGLHAPLRLANLTYTPPTEVEIAASNGSTRRQHIAVLRCEAKDPKLASYFLRIVSSVLLDDALEGDEARFESALQSVVRLFKAVQGPGSRTIQGLWAELAIVAWASSSDSALSAWHSSPHALHDFTAGSLRLEVKSTTDPLREHTFLYDQLQTLDGGETLVASLILEENDSGSSINDLVAAIRARLQPNGDGARRLEAIVTTSLGNAFVDAESLRFDPAGARESLRLYRAADVPRVPGPIPEAVKRVQFSVDLSAVPPIELGVARALVVGAEILPPDSGGN